MSTIAVDQITDSSGGNTVTINGATPTAYNTMGRNRIINGDMRIDQRNAGASVTPTTSTYTLDRWIAILSQASKFSVQQSTTAPAGFKNSLLITSTSAYTVGSGENFIIAQYVEGFNVSDLGWGTADAQSITISFKVRSSLTGTFGGSVSNSANNRSYPFTYTISSADTWETKSVTIAGDTSGTWLTDSGVGLRLWLGLGVGSTLSGTAGAWAGANYRSATGATSVVGTSGATFYITGVQLEVGSVATEFERRPYGAELALCQRYFTSFKASAANPAFSSGVVYAANEYLGYTQLPVTMRSAPSFSVSAVGDFSVIAGNSGYAATAMSAVTSTDSARITATPSTNLTIGHGSFIQRTNNGNTCAMNFSAEL